MKVLLGHKLALWAMALLAVEGWCDVWAASCGSPPLCVLIFVRPAEYWPMPAIALIVLMRILVGQWWGVWSRGR